MWTSGRPANYYCPAVLATSHVYESQEAWRSLAHSCIAYERAAQRLTYWGWATVPHTTWRADTMASCAAGATAMQDGAAQRLTYWVRPTVPHTTGQADTMASYAAGATAMQDEVCSTLPTG